MESWKYFGGILGFISQLILDHEHQFWFYFIDIMARTFSQLIQARGAFRCRTKQ